MIALNVSAFICVSAFFCVSAFICVSAFFCVSASTARAGTGSVTVLPLAGGNPSGLRLSVDSRWVSGNGYRPIRLTLSTSQGQPAARDRALLVEMSFRYVNYSRSGAIVDELVSTYVTLPAGESQIDYTLRMLQRAKWNALEVSVYEDGILQQDLTSVVTASVRRTVSGWSEGAPRMMIISSDAAKLSDSLTNYSTDANQRTIPDMRIVASLFPGSIYFSLADIGTTAEPINNDEAAGIIDEWQDAILLHPEDVPTEFLDYSCFEWIIISRGDLEGFQKKHPEKWNAVRVRVAAGGALFVYGVDPVQATANPLGLPPSNASLKFLDDNLLADASVHQQAAYWTRYQGYQQLGVGIPGFSINEPVFRRMAQARAELRFTPLKLKDPVNVRGFGRPGSETFPCTLSSDDIEEDELKLYGIDPGSEDNPVRFDRPYLTRDAGMGIVVAFSGDPFPGRTYNWVTVISQIRHERWSWQSQTGISLNAINGDFWTLFIPGVGTAPVVTFLVLISLFAFAIGPINYFLLRHFERLHLILVTVPVGAMLVIVSLIAYAFFSEGFGTRARSRSVTILDQGNETAVSWARQNYYVGLGARRSISFEKDTIVYPVHFYPHRPANDEPKREVYWEGKQYLENGFMESRTQSQFLLCRANKTSSKLEVARPKGKIQVTNKLGSHITHLYLVDKLGMIYSGQEIAEGATADLKASSAGERADILRKISADSTPEFPLGFDSKLYQSNQDDFYFSRHEADTAIPSPSMKSNTLEKFLSETLFQSGVQKGQRAYVAVVERAIQIPLISDDVVDENGFHVVVGTY
ncbi:MAG: hypothetical protein ACI9HK_003506 [Pirellulaceae bacterium]